MASKKATQSVWFGFSLDDRGDVSDTDWATTKSGVSNQEYVVEVVIPNRTAPAQKVMQVVFTR